MRQTVRLAMLMILACSFYVHAGIAPFKFKSSGSRTHLVELYTSEGCSSCPSADRWISKLKSEKALWSSFIPVVFHVDYWDRLGWKDIYADPSFSTRQRKLAASWLSNRLYTPMFVLDGKEWRRKSKEALLSKNGQGGTLKAELREGQTIRLSFEPGSKVRDDIEFHCALLGMDIVTDVARGENAGRQLQHDFTVLKYLSTRAKADEGRYTGTIMISSGNQKSVKNNAIAFWVTEYGRSEPLQAAGGPVSIKKEKVKR